MFETLVTQHRKHHFAHITPKINGFFNISIKKIKKKPCIAIHKKLKNHVYIYTKNECFLQEKHEKPCIPIHEGLHVSFFLRNVTGLDQITK